MYNLNRWLKKIKEDKKLNGVAARLRRSTAWRQSPVCRGSTVGPGPSLLDLKGIGQGSGLPGKVLGSEIGMLGTHQQ